MVVGGVTVGGCDPPSWHVHVVVCGVLGDDAARVSGRGRGQCPHRLRRRLRPHVGSPADGGALSSFAGMSAGGVPMRRTRSGRVWAKDAARFPVTGSTMTS